MIRLGVFRRRAVAEGRHAAGYTPAQQESYAEPELAGWQRLMLAEIASEASGAAPNAVHNGRVLANMLRRDLVAGDLALAEALLIVLDFARMCGEAAAGTGADEYALVRWGLKLAVLDLTELHRQLA